MALRDRLAYHCRRVLMPLGFEFYQHNKDDRRVLETIILPYYASRADCQQILSIGADWYTRGYRHQFRHCTYRVLEIRPDHARRYGGKGAITGSCTEMQRHVGSESLDVVIFNGVFGYGLNDPEGLEQAFRGFHDSLKPGGELVFGWDDVPWHSPFDPLTTPSLGLFEPLLFPPLGQERWLTETSYRHTYLFLRRPR